MIASIERNRNENTFIPRTTEKDRSPDQEREKKGGNLERRSVSARSNGPAMLEVRLASHSTSQRLRMFGSSCDDVIPCICFPDCNEIPFIHSAKFTL